MNGTLGQDYKGKLVLGQKIYCGLHGGKDGHIVAIHGEQSEKTVGSMNGVMFYGGSAHFDIIYDDGSMTRMLPECILRGVQWHIFDEFIDSDGILDAYKLNKQKVAEDKAAAEAMHQRRAIERDQHREKFSHLTASSGDVRNDSKLAAKNIRIELKRHFPGVKFSVTTDYDSVSVKWTDGPTTKQVEQIAKRHSSGTFDGMTDSQGWDDENTFGQVFGEVRYVWVNRSISDHTNELVAKAYCEMQGVEFQSMNQHVDGESLYTISNQITAAHDIPVGHIVTGICKSEANSAFGSWNNRFGGRHALVTEPKSAAQAMDEAALKKVYPVWTENGYLTSDPIDSKWKWRREFRKASTAEAEAEKLRKLGYEVQITGGSRADSRFIKLVAAPASEVPASEVAEPVKSATEPVEESSNTLPEEIAFEILVGV